MFINHFADFRKTLLELEKQQPTSQDVLVRDYLGQNTSWNQPGVVTKSFILDVGGTKMPIQAQTTVSLEKEFVAKLNGKGPPKNDDQVPVVIGSAADPKIPTQSITAHGKPSKYAGQIVTIPYRTYVWMTQPGDPSSAGAAGGMGGMPGAPPGGMPMPGGPAPGGMGTPPMPGGPPAM